MPKHTIYTVEDKEGRVHTVKVPEEPNGLTKFGQRIQKLLWTFLGAGIIYLIGYLMGLGAGG